MRYVNSKELRSNPAILWKDEETIITVNGKPVAVVTRIDGDPENTLLALKQAKAMIAVEKIRLISKQKRLDKISDEEINQVVKEVRNENKSSR
ncbi:hypothetical protein [Thermosipho ferrireducens]|uniref:hypothetical protein n=1 Tax=Thermosipho ferrireducens TaxID=2571116 RepID=UPI001D18B957|nr:hypothetical protein [Thermosipho ferrireducens]